MHSTLKDKNNSNFADIINPMTGKVESYNIEKFAHEQTKNVEDAIDPNQIQQIIMVCVDNSKSENDKKIRTKYDPAQVVYQYYTLLNDNINHYQIPSIQGLITYNKNIEITCPLSPFYHDYEIKRNITFPICLFSRLWDSLSFSCDEINKISHIYNKAKCRILVITDGDDSESSTKVEDVVKKLIKNNIIVDSIVIGERDCKMICAVSHATYGHSYHIDDIKDGVKLFEKEAFLNCNLSKLNKLPLIPYDKKSNPNYLRRDLSLITDKFMYEACSDAKFDDIDVDVENLELDTFKKLSKRDVTTPLYICAKFPGGGIRRVLKELQLAAYISDPNSPIYDPDIRIFPLVTLYCLWKVFIKAPEETPYEGKWWFLYVRLGELYPATAPDFQFVTVPYHLNVTPDGKICSDIFEKEYFSSKHVIDIITEIKELFLLPNPDLPVRIDALHAFRNDKDEYFRLAKESTVKNALDDFSPYINRIRSNVPVDFQLEPHDFPPPHLTSQISNQRIKKIKQFWLLLEFIMIDMSSRDLFHLIKILSVS